ncbi:hypothetical protein DIURU_001816 [Diutina rugosa]|uniref:Uncharacterized protein n=1 Tax=Diutina rugosa TaxID=5481 RepID=A0A642USX7_DIURU|nr:uncharacterized protein DIURU_001816 [Diutina rugosa]KAA8904740.1 hypothetical protein DIURU_001816 [Diutina rugosa]
MAPSRFVALPYDVYDEIFKFLDLYSLRSMFEAYSIRPDYETFRRTSTRHFKKRVENVTVEHLCDGDTSKVDFPMLAMFPPCKINVEVPVELFEIVKLYLKQVKVERLDLNVYDEGAGFSRINLGDISEVTELVLFGVLVNTDEFPVTVEQLSLVECQFESSHPSLVHLTNLTKCRIGDCDHDFYGELPPSITYISIFNGEDASVDGSSLPNLKHISGPANGIFWDRIESADVDEIPEGTICANLKDLELSSSQSLKNIHCPNLRSVSLDGRINHINDVLTYGQQNQLESCEYFGRTNDLTLMSNLRRLRVGYKERLTEHTPLPPNLVELVIDSGRPVEGIPLQLEVFGYICSSVDCDVTVRSPTLKRLSVDYATNLTVNCANLETLELECYSSLVECNVPNVTELRARDREGLLERVPKLRRLTLLDGKPLVADLVINQRLEYISLGLLRLGEVTLSADTILIRDCKFIHTPTITARSLTICQSDVQNVTITNVTCQELICDNLNHIPLMVEKLILSSYSSFSRDLFSNCRNLTSLTIRHTDIKPVSSNRLDLPSTLRKLRLTSCQNVHMLNFENVTQLDYIGCDSRSLEMVPGTIGVLKPANFPNGLVSSGPNLWYRPDLLT